MKTGIHAPGKDPGRCFRPAAPHRSDDAGHWILDNHFALPGIADCGGAGDGQSASRFGGPPEFDAGVHHLRDPGPAGLFLVWVD
jgi:hypothetical protein